MSANIVLLPLTQWTEVHLSSILKATNQADFDAAFDAFIAKDVSVTFNGTHISRAQLKSNWLKDKFDEEFASVKFNSLVEVPANTNEPILAGFVGAFFTATIGEAIIIHDTPVEHTLTSSINITVEQDKSLHRPTGPIKGFFDGRRVTNLNQVILDKPVPIDFQSPPVKA